ncbi:hypothetical protein LY78DRAFT_251443 [Colletotrichum sublineola]|nr:hypothetical protein LY78DRAFT_251443 [Colletotrichum sublineola]
MLGAQIDSAWAEALSVLLTRMRSELGDMEHLPAAAVGEGTWWWWWWWWSRIGLGTHPAISMGQRRVRRFVEIIITGQRIVQEAKRDLGSEYRPGQDQGQDGVDGGGGPAVVMNKITQSLCTWADILDSEAEAGGEASSPEARVAAGQPHYPTLGEEEAQRGAGNDAAAVCGILERNRDGRVKERIEVLDAFQSLLDEGLLGRWSLEEDLEAANGWFGADRDALASIERRMIEVYRACYAFVGKVFMRRG